LIADDLAYLAFARALVVFEFERVFGGDVGRLGVYLNGLGARPRGGADRIH
jgi:hypothetical protein